MNILTVFSGYDQVSQIYTVIVFVSFNIEVSESAQNDSGPTGTK
jgi:hypothetical protein